MRRPVLRDTHPRIDGEAAVGEREHRVEVELHHLWEVMDQVREPQEEIEGR